MEVKKIIGLEKPIIDRMETYAEKSAPSKDFRPGYFTVIYPALYSKSTWTAIGVVNSKV